MGADNNTTVGCAVIAYIVIPSLVAKREMGSGQ